jgi:5-methyltetrahydrofolate corrinoid/iron sulfur protein methyltransferase
MLLIGESLNVISKKIGKSVQRARSQADPGRSPFSERKRMDYIDINLGPAKKDGHELMPWVVQTVQEVVPDLPLALDTSNIDAIEAALKVIKQVPSGTIWSTPSWCVPSATSAWFPWQQSTTPISSP